MAMGMGWGYGIVLWLWVWCRVLCMGMVEGHEYGGGLCHRAMAVS